MVEIKSVIFCTNCRCFFKLDRWPFPYLATCPSCQYTAKLLRRRNCNGHDVATLSGLILVTVHGALWNKLLKLVPEPVNVEAEAR